MNGIERIADERKRQLEVEGWTAAHDSQHDRHELAFAAAAYAIPPGYRREQSDGTPPEWPWDPKWWKPGDRVRELAKAGALIAAEIDRLLWAASDAATKGTDATS